MVLINGVKYACERCIRGHRATTCTHTDQRLIMIKPKGRPSTTCKHCKELRINKNVNPSGVCTCSKKDSANNINNCNCPNGDVCKCHSKRKSKTKEKDKELRERDLNENGVDNVKNEIENEMMPPSDKQKIIKKKKKRLQQNNNTNNNNANNNTSNNNLIPNSSDDQRLNLLDQNTSVGLYPLNNTKKISQNTRTRVGEVTVSLKEYLPYEFGGIGNIDAQQLPVTNTTTKTNTPINMAPDTMTLSTQSDLTALDMDMDIDFNTFNTDIPLNQLKNTISPSNNKNVASQAQSDIEDNISSLNYFNNDTVSLRSSQSNLINNINQNSNSNATPNTNNINSTSNGILDNLLLDFNPVTNHTHQHHYSNNNQSTIGDSESIRSVEVLSLTPSFMDLTDNMLNNNKNTNNSNTNINSSSPNSTSNTNIQNNGLTHFNATLQNHINFVPQTNTNSQIGSTTKIGNSSTLLPQTINSTTLGPSNSQRLMDNLDLNNQMEIRDNLNHSLITNTTFYGADAQTSNTNSSFNITNNNNNTANLNFQQDIPDSLNSILQSSSNTLNNNQNTNLLGVTDTVSNMNDINMLPIIDSNFNSASNVIIKKNNVNESNVNLNSTANTNIHINVNDNQNFDYFMSTI